MQRIRAVCIQSGPGGIDPATVEAELEAAGEVDLAVLPELAHLPYFPREKSDAWQGLAVCLDDPLVDSFRAVAARRRCHLVVPLYLRDAGVTYNSAVVAGPSGDLLAGRRHDGSRSIAYHKTHLCELRTGFFEEAYFAAGHGTVLWDTSIGTLGVAICYDRHFPEIWRSLRAGGAEVVCVPTASPASARTTFVAEMQAMAFQQHVYALIVNRAGREDLVATGTTTVYLGQSCIVGPNGEVLAIAGGAAETLVAELDPATLEASRLDLPFAEHRQSSAYRLDAWSNGSDR